MADHSHAELNSRDDPDQGGRRKPWRSDYHDPVLWKSVLEGLVTDPRGVYVDATLGGGGHTAALLSRLDPEGRIIAVDRDEDALDVAGRRLAEDVSAGRLTLERANFGDIEGVLSRLGVDRVDGVLLDIGVSSHQIDTPDRGFSHRFEGPLDMRMDRRRRETAADLVNGLEESDLADLIYEFGEEPASRRIARRIVAERPVETTTELADIVRSSVPDRTEAKSVARVFQALRIAVNAELEELEDALHGCTRIVRAGGRLVVISYHSLEDRRVKRFMRSGNFEGRVVRDLYGNHLTPWRELTKKPVGADEEEIERNPRARSARLRIAERTRTAPDESTEYGHPHHQ
jgi:16S rRNA (cytosine1402-N4)-methyltransferase